MMYVTPLKTTTVYVLATGASEAAPPLSPDLLKTLKSCQIDAVVVSPSAVTRALVEPFSETAELTSLAMPDLRDHRLSLRGNDPDDPLVLERFTNRQIARPGGESFNAAAARMRNAILTISRRPVAAPLFSTHIGLLAALLSQLNRNFTAADFQALPDPVLYKITHQRGTPRSAERLV